jgi:hypothetical protein
LKLDLFHRDDWVGGVGTPTWNFSSLLFTDLFTDAVVFAYALWTIACHTTVFLEGNTRHGLTAAAIIAAVCLLTAVVLLWRRRSWREAYLQDLRQSPDFPAVPLSSSARIALFLAIPIVVITWLVTRNPWLVWIQIVVGYGAASFYALRMTPLATPQAETTAYRERVVGIALFGAGFICMAFTLLAVRPRTDESFYSSMAVAITNYPNLAISKYTTLHGLASDLFTEQPLFPPYRVHSFELLGGYLSYLSGIEAIRIVHLVIAPFFGFFAPFAIARLLRLLTPRHWLAALFITLSFYFLEGSGSRGFANQAFVRLFNGKSVMLTVAVPLLFLYGLRFGSKPTLPRFVLLACSQIAAVGMSSTGIWLAPLITTISVVVAVPSRRALPRTIGLTLVSSGYVLLLGFWLAGQMNLGAPSIDKMTPSSGPVRSSFELLGEALLPIFGNESTAIAHLSSIALVCAFARNVATWRLFVALGVVLSLGLANPFLSNAVQNYVTGPSTYERIFWIVPVPIALGIWSTNLFGFAKKVTPACAAIVAVLAAIAGYFVTAIDRPVISKANGAWITFPPKIKVWPQYLEVAQKVCDYVQNDRYVLAPKNISLLLGTMSKCGIPLFTENRWISGPAEDIDRRAQLVAFVSATDIGLDWTDKFYESLSKYRISAVVTTKKESRNYWLAELLLQAGFAKEDDVGGYLIWLPDKASRSKSVWRAKNVAQSACGLALGAPFVLAPFGISRQLALLKNCPKPLIAFHPPGAGIGLGNAELKRLDDLVSRKGDLLDDEVDWFTHAIDDHKVGAVVILKKAIENQKVITTLNDLGFVDNIVQKNLILVRESQDFTGTAEPTSLERQR